MSLTISKNDLSKIPPPPCLYTSNPSPFQKFSHNKISFLFVPNLTLNMWYPPGCIQCTCSSKPIPVFPTLLRNMTTSNIAGNVRISLPCPPGLNTPPCLALWDLSINTPPLLLNPQLTTTYTTY